MERKDGYDEKMAAAPYERENAATRAQLDPTKPWREAGRSWAAQAHRLRAYYRTSGTFGDKLQLFVSPNGHPEVSRLYARANAALRVGRRLDKLTPGGWIVMHDRRLAGTEETLDHVAVGPDGITIVQSVAAAGQLPDVPVPATAHEARVRLNDMNDRIMAALSAALPEGWRFLCYLAVAVEGKTQTIVEPPQVCPRGAVDHLIEQHPRMFSRMQVMDMALALEDSFPYADLGQPSTP